MYRFFIVTALLAACVYHAACDTAALSCPVRPKGEADTHFVEERSNNFIAAFGKHGYKDFLAARYYADMSSYTFNISVCGPADSFITQTNTRFGSPINIGRYNESYVDGGVDWLMYTFGGGQKYNYFCGKKARRTMLLVKCENGTKRSKMHVIEKARTTADKVFCNFSFGYNHPAACSTVERRPTKLSTGIILCIIFVFLALVCVAAFGMLYKRYMSHKPKDQTLLVGSKVGIDQL